MENQNIKELEAMIVVLAKEINALKKKLNLSYNFHSEKQTIDELKKEAQKIITKM